MLYLAYFVGPQAAFLLCIRCVQLLFGIWNRNRRLNDLAHVKPFVRRSASRAGKSGFRFSEVNQTTEKNHGLRPANTTHLRRETGRRGVFLSTTFPAARPSAGPASRSTLKARWGLFSREPAQSWNIFTAESISCHGPEASRCPRSSSGSGLPGGTLAGAAWRTRPSWHPPLWCTRVTRRGASCTQHRSPSLVKWRANLSTVRLACDPGRRRGRDGVLTCRVPAIPARGNRGDCRSSAIARTASAPPATLDGAQRPIIER